MQVVEQLAKRYDTAIVTGRSVDTICELATWCWIVPHDSDAAIVFQVHFLRLDNLYYAGSHGFDIRGPDKQRMKTVRCAAGEMASNPPLVCFVP